MWYLTWEPSHARRQPARFQQFTDHPAVAGTRQENIRILARSSFDVSLVVVGRLPVYRRIAADATQMRAAGVSVRAISLHFGVDYHTAEKALGRWFRAR